MKNLYEKRVQSEVSLSEKRIGRGLQLSPMVAGGSHITNSGIDRISQSLYVILSTKKGERLFQPEFGTRIYECLFETNDFILCDKIKMYVEEDIKKWEDRITFEVEVSIDENDDSRVIVEIFYQLKGDQTKYSFVYPLVRTIQDLGGETNG